MRSKIKIGLEDTEDWWEDPLKTLPGERTDAYTQACRQTSLLSTN